MHESIQGRPYGDLSQVPILDAVEALFLDLDGTLVTTEPIHLHLHRSVLEPLGALITDEDVKANVGVNNDVAFYQRLLDRHDLDYDPRVLVAEKDRRTNWYMAHCPVPMMPGAAELLRILNERKIPFAVVTATKRGLAEAVFAKVGIKPQLAITFEDVSAAKPDPEPYLKALSRLSAHCGREFDPKRCLAVEDSRAGIASAVAAGLPTLAMAGVIPEQEQLDLGASAVINDFHQWFHAKPSSFTRSHPIT